MDTDVKLLGVLDGTLEWRGNNPRHKWRLLLTQSPQHMVHPLDIHCLLAHNPLRHCLLVFFSVCLRACEQSEKKRCKFGNVADVIVRFSSHGRVHSERNQKGTTRQQTARWINHKTKTNKQQQEGKAVEPGSKCCKSLVNSEGVEAARQRNNSGINAIKLATCHVVHWRDGGCGCHHTAKGRRKMQRRGLTNWNLRRDNVLGSLAALIGL